MRKQNLGYKLRDQSHEIFLHKILKDKSKTIAKEKSLEARNLYFLFLSMVYLLLNSDSKFLYEFAYLWEEANLV